MSPFWKKVGNFFDKVGEKIEKGVETVIDYGRQAYEGIKEGINDAAKWVKDKLNNKPKGPAPKVDLDPPKSKPKTEKEKEQWVEDLGEAIRIFQEKALKKTNIREKQIKDAYQGAYISIIDTLKNNDIDVSSIEFFMNQKIVSFEHKMRDEVNTKVSPSYPAWKSIIEKDVHSESDAKKVKNEMDQYTKRVYDVAENNLLDALEKAFEETNKHINACVSKNLEDKRNALKMMKQSLVELSRGKESQEKELLKIAKEEAMMAFVKYEAERYLD